MPQLQRIPGMRGQIRLAVAPYDVWFGTTPSMSMKKGDIVLVLTGPLGNGLYYILWNGMHAQMTHTGVEYYTELIS